MTNRRTRREIVINLASRIKKPMFYHTAGNQNSYGQSCVVFPNGKVKEYNTKACTFYQTRTEYASDYIEKQIQLFNRECKKVNAIAYITNKIENYI